MSEKKDKWYKGWWLILLVIFIGFIAWKAYPYVKTSQFVVKMLKKVRGVKG